MRWPLFLVLVASPIAYSEPSTQARFASARRGEPQSEVPDSSHLKFFVKHSFAPQEAKARVGYMLKYWHDRFGVQSTWRDNDVLVFGNVMGISIRAHLEVSDAYVGAEADDPGFVFRSAAKNYIDKKLRKYLHPQYSEM